MKYKAGQINKEISRKKQKDSEADKGSMATKEKKEDKNPDNNNRKVETYSASPQNADHVPPNGEGNVNNASNIFFIKTISF